MKAIFYFFIFILLAGCNEPQVPPHDSILADTSRAAAKADPSQVVKATWLLPYKLSVLVLPPYDEIANAGISPNVQQYLEQQLAADTNFALTKFSYKRFMNVAYQNVYDKKYCQPIIDKVKTDVIVMSKLEMVSQVGKMDADEWDLSIRIYNTSTGKQIDSKIRLSKVNGEKMRQALAEQQEQLRTEIILSQ